MIKNKLGHDPFVWWIGVVEDRNDPLMIGRCRVRIVGTHTEDKIQLPTSGLPWAHPLLPLNNSSVYTPKEGDMIMGFFMDSEDGQYPVMMGFVPGVQTKSAKDNLGFYDNRTDAELDSAPRKPQDDILPNPKRYPRNLDEPTTSRLARNEIDYPSVINASKAQSKINTDDSQKVDVEVEPPSSYSAKYPYNNVYESESGHALEFDDTKNNERIHLYHRSGSYVEYRPDGSKSEKIVRDNFSVIIGNDSVYIHGTTNLYVDGDVNVKVGGDYTMNVDGDIVMNGRTVTINQDGAKGAARLNDTVDSGDGGALHADGSNKIESSSQTVFIGD